MRLPLPSLLAAALLLAAPVAAQDSTVVYLVRHAEKAATDPVDPPLSPAGEARARALAARLAGLPLDAAIVTQYRRSRETAAPTLAAARLAPWLHPTRGGDLPHPAAVARAVHGPLAGRTVLVVGHSNTVPAIVHALGGPDLPDLCETEYAHLFVIVLRPGAEPRVRRESYGAPDPPGADVCERG
jgi:broad specificity phosphatase PhoE